MPTWQLLFEKFWSIRVCQKAGTAYDDKALDHMFQNFDKPRATYFVVEDQGRVIGCAGVAQLENDQGNIDELQKMYFLEVKRAWNWFHNDE